MDADRSLHGLRMKNFSRLSNHGRISREHLTRNGKKAKMGSFLGTDRTGGDAEGGDLGEANEVGGGIGGCWSCPG